MHLNCERKIARFIRPSLELVVRETHFGGFHANGSTVRKVSLWRLIFGKLNYLLPDIVYLKSSDTTSTDSLISPRLLSPLPRPERKVRKNESERASLIDFCVSPREIAFVRQGRTRADTVEGRIFMTSDGAEFSITPSAVTCPYHSGAYSYDGRRQRLPFAE